MNSKETQNFYWQKNLYLLFKSREISQISFVPDAGHSALIRMAVNDPKIKTIPLTTEEEGVAAASGAWLGGEKSVLLMQSSGVGNCINMFSILKSCEFPFLTFITMRGEFEEFNSWQIPMGSATQGCLELMGINVFSVCKSADVLPVAEKTVTDVFEKNLRCAILLSQKLIGKKEW